MHPTPLSIPSHKLCKLFLSPPCYPQLFPSFLLLPTSHVYHPFLLWTYCEREGWPMCLLVPYILLYYHAPYFTLTNKIKLKRKKEILLLLAFLSSEKESKNKSQSTPLCYSQAIKEARKVFWASPFRVRTWEHQRISLRPSHLHSSSPLWCRKSPNSFRYIT